MEANRLFIWSHPLLVRLNSSSILEVHSVDICTYGKIISHVYNKLQCDRKLRLQKVEPALGLWKSNYS